MKKWATPSVDELKIKETANAQAPDEDYDGPWVQIEGKWMIPGNGSQPV